MRPRLVVLAALPLLLFIGPLRAIVESRMSLHMLLEFPLLLTAGWALGRLRTEPRFLHGLDALGLLGAGTASIVFAFWMIPAALDLSLLSSEMAAVKYSSWVTAGLLLAWAHERLGAIVAAFFLGNAAWMLATAGLLYRDADAQLCVNYLIDDQALTGGGLLIWALALAGLAALRLRPFLRSS